MLLPLRQHDKTDRVENQANPPIPQDRSAGDTRHLTEFCSQRLHHDLLLSEEFIYQHCTPLLTVVDHHQQPLGGVFDGMRNIEEAMEADQGEEVVA